MFWAGSTQIWHIAMKRLKMKSCKNLILLVGADGLEPPASTV